MTPYEFLYSLAYPFLPALYGQVRHDLRQLIAATPSPRPQLLDVGGRKSPYTVGMPADISLLDIPRTTDVQNELFLGVDDALLQEIKRRRSNIVQIFLQDMTSSTLPSESYDGIICVEVIEHVVAAEAFVYQVARVLKPGGWLYLTTLNGDYIPNAPPNYNPDHVKHYRRAEMENLLATQFSRVAVSWGVRTGKYHRQGLRSFSARRPVATLQAMASNVINRLESKGVAEQSTRTAHLIATAYK